MIMQSIQTPMLLIVRFYLDVENTRSATWAEGSLKENSQFCLRSEREGEDLTQ